MARVQTDTSVFSRIARAVEREARMMATALGEEQVRQIKRRTAQGLGVNDHPMPGLTPQYATRKRGRSLRNLRQTGQLMRDLTHKKARKRDAGWQAVVTIKTERSQRIGAYNQKIAPWFGVSGKDKEALFAIVQTFPERLKRRLGA